MWTSWEAVITQEKQHGTKLRRWSIGKMEKNEKLHH
jgi:hypothetical protein